MQRLTMEGNEYVGMEEERTKKGED